MPEPSRTIAQTQPFTASSSLVASEILLSLALPTVLFSLACARTLEETIRSLGLASEEIFRGVSLPLLTGGQPGKEKPSKKLTANRQESPTHSLPRSQ